MKTSDSLLRALSWPLILPKQTYARFTILTPHPYTGSTYPEYRDADIHKNVASCKQLFSP